LHVKSLKFVFNFKEINLEDPASVTGSGDKKIKKEPQKVDREGKTKQSFL